jgi:hypothetical protein
VARDRVTFEVATLEHARELARHMRAADAAEVFASGGYAPLEALEVAIAWSTRQHGGAWAGRIDGELAALFGIGRRTLLSRVGIPWLLTGPAVERYPVAFVRACRSVLATWAEDFDELEQFVDARYGEALRWAARLGFVVGPEEPFGPQHLPFRRIHLVPGWNPARGRAKG